MKTNLTCRNRRITEERVQQAIRNGAEQIEEHCEIHDSEAPVLANDVANKLSSIRL
jgi:hypothetical protein